MHANEAICHYCFALRGHRRCAKKHFLRQPWRRRFNMAHGYSSSLCADTTAVVLTLELDFVAMLHFSCADSRTSHHSSDPPCTHLHARTPTKQKYHVYRALPVSEWFPFSCVLCERVNRRVASVTCRHAAHAFQLHTSSTTILARWQNEEGLIRIRI